MNKTLNYCQALTAYFSGKNSNQCDIENFLLEKWGKCGFDARGVFDAKSGVGSIMSVD